MTHRSGEPKAAVRRMRRIGCTVISRALSLPPSGHRPSFHLQSLPRNAVVSPRQSQQLVSHLLKMHSNCGAAKQGMAGCTPKKSRKEPSNNFAVGCKCETIRPSASGTQLRSDGRRRRRTENSCPSLPLSIDWERGMAWHGVFFSHNFFCAAGRFFWGKEWMEWFTVLNWKK